MTTATPGSAALLALADKIAAFTPSKGPLSLIARERRMIEDALRIAAKPDEEEGVREATAKTCLDDTGLKITKELYKAVSGHTGDACLLAMIGSWGDTLDDPDILAGLHRYNEMGECFIPALSTTGHPKP